MKKKEKDGRRVRGDKVALGERVNRVYSRGIHAEGPCITWHSIGRLGTPRNSRDEAERTARRVRARKGFKLRVGEGRAS